MNKNIFQYLKIIIVGTVISVGISYVYAWTAPTAIPPGGNVSAPINTSATAQTKVGDLKVSGNIGIGLGASSPAQKLDVAGSAQITGTIWGGGAQTNYGATTIRGGKNGWSGINFAESSGVNNGTLMMNPSYSGFFGATDNKWRMLVTEPTAATSYGSVYAQDYYIGATGKWASSAQSRVTGSCAVGQAIKAINADGTVTCESAGGGGMGVGQTWQDVKASRVSGTNYLNNTGKPIQVIINGDVNGGLNVYVGLTASSMIKIATYPGVNAPFYTSFIVPDGYLYKVVALSFQSWAELR